MIPVLEHWHIEPSSRCALKCPRCPRVEVPESLLNKQLDLAFFVDQIGKDMASQISKVTFCGNDGDPIYCTELMEIILWLKQCNPEMQITIITNGSYKSPYWWSALGKVLNENDEIHWSIDGWDQESNEQYRVNSDWNSIKDGIIAFRETNTTTYTIWAAIAFRFNAPVISTRMVQLAEDLRFDAYQLTRSTKFGSKYDTYPKDDPLEPAQDLIASGHRYERELTRLTRKTRPGEQLKKLYDIRADALAAAGKHSGVCLIGNKGVFLNSRGEFYPCCWVANRYDHNKVWTDWAAEHNLYNYTLEELLKLPVWDEVYSKFDSFECVHKCTPDKLKDYSHTIEW